MQKTNHNTLTCHKYKTIVSENFGPPPSFQPNMCQPNTSQLIVSRVCLLPVAVNQRRSQSDISGLTHLAVSLKLM